MRNRLTSLLLLVCFFVYSQEDLNIDLETEKDTIEYIKNTEISEVRNFSSDLQEKYAGKDFVYKEDTSNKEEDSAPISSGFIQFLVFFMSKIFPFLLGGFIIFVILKALVGFDIRFWKSQKSTNKTTEKLIYEDEDIHEVDLDTLLQKAIVNKNYRLAIRYYYLTSLKGLSNKKIIEYHKDKTNSEYINEIENSELKTNFSYLSYIYSYVWYGDFPINEDNFSSVQNKYQTFLNSML
ncbi:hypothetical protein [Polaribacter ponticola]|uniref:DUF4129 domain-containing protein n=1 Tax=Polaribacter ponticola TaxID=2978475 RepID=A0ABT5S7H2_9FLAO|nr:hypothetical protein [Polaribacter sp. MSW5]MDD7914045.1 hypothetical protein [Polaribacter sp. MSW5]